MPSNISDPAIYILLSLISFAFLAIISRHWSLICVKFFRLTPKKTNSEGTEDAKETAWFFGCVCRYEIYWCCSDIRYQARRHFDAAGDDHRSQRRRCPGCCRVSCYTRDKNKT